VDRKQLGQKKLGAPAMATFDALVGTVDEKNWADFRREPVGYYFQKMIGYWLLQMADKGLSDKQLGEVKPADVKVVVLCLFRDMFRRNAALLRPKTKGDSWVEPLFAEVAQTLAVPSERLRDGGEPYELDDMGQCQWAEPLSSPFGIIPQKLFACHSAVVTGAREEFEKQQ
jgi:hypothetical protein